MEISGSEPPILHIIVVGFNHLKGWQVEYSYPSFSEKEKATFCPEKWKYLAHLAIPDGSHNFDEDTVFFHLPSLEDENKTVFAVGCYKQISSEGVQNKTSDVTRRTIQKSIVVLSSLPLYDKIEVKLSLIAKAYFEQADFTKYEILQDAFTNLRNCLVPPLSPDAYKGLLATELLLYFGHETLLLLKLLLLEKRVLFFSSPVKPLCRAILTLISLIPGTIERGLSNCISAKREICYEAEISDVKSSPTHSSSEEVQQSCDKQLEKVVDSGSPVLPSPTESAADLNGSQTSINSDSSARRLVSSESLTNIASKFSSIKSKIGTALWKGNGGQEEEDRSTQPSPTSPLVDIADEDCGFPLMIFGELDSRRIDINDPELRRQLRLTTEDLRFVDSVVRQIDAERQEFIDGVGWQGGEEWIRLQFKTYLIQLLRVTLLEENAKELDSFNSTFVQAFKQTRNYRTWSSTSHHGLLKLVPGHPGSGQLSVSDMRLRLSHSMSTSESGRKLTVAAANTGRAVAQTGKAVGDVIAQAKGNITAWWNGSATL